MWISKRVLVSGVMAVTAAMSMALAVGAFGHGGGHHRGHGNAALAASLAPSQTTDPAFHGVTPGAVPWVLRRGDVELSRNRLELEVRGLVIPNPPGDGTAGPVKTVSASLYCGADSNATPADSTAAAPLSPSGNARIRDRSFATPDSCLAPLILVHPNGDTTHYIAVEGRRP
jgi:hypothetical protein